MKPVNNGSLIGQVTGISHRQEGFWLLQRHVWDLRLLVEDGAGGWNQTIPVQMVGMTLDGALRDGDRVKAPGPWSEGEILRPRWVYNLTTDSKVTAKPWTSFTMASIIFLALFALAPLLWIGTAVLAGGGVGSATRSLQHAVLETLRSHDPCERLPRDIADARFEMKDRLYQYRDIDLAMGLQKRIAQWAVELQRCPAYEKPNFRCDALAQQVKDLTEIDMQWISAPSVDQMPVLKEYYGLRRQWLREDITTLGEELQACSQQISQP